MTEAFYWEIICDQILKEGWSVGWAKQIRPDGVELWTADAHRDDQCVFSGEVSSDSRRIIGTLNHHAREIANPVEFEDEST